MNKHSRGKPKGSLLIWGGFLGLFCYLFPGVLLLLSVLLIAAGILALP